MSDNATRDEVSTILAAYPAHVLRVQPMEQVKLVVEILHLIHSKSKLLEADLSA